VKTEEPRNVLIRNYIREFTSLGALSDYSICETGKVNVIGDVVVRLKNGRLPIKFGIVVGNFEILNFINWRTFTDFKNLPDSILGKERTIEDHKNKINSFGNKMILSGM